MCVQGPGADLAQDGEDGTRAGTSFLSPLVLVYVAYEGYAWCGEQYRQEATRYTEEVGYIFFRVGYMRDTHCGCQG